MSSEVVPVCNVTAPESKVTQLQIRFPDCKMLGTTIHDEYADLHRDNVCKTFTMFTMCHVPRELLVAIE